MSPLSTHQPDVSIKLKLLDTTTKPVDVGDRVRNGTGSNEKGSVLDIVYLPPAPFLQRPLQPLPPHRTVLGDAPLGQQPIHPAPL